VPGLTTHIRLTPSRLGRYDIVCAELCGLGHSTMRGYTHVISAAAFSTWVNKQKQSGSGGATGSSASSGGNTIPPAG
jgi:cytochrome c oxidase subunit 2